MILLPLAFRGTEAKERRRRMEVKMPEAYTAMQGYIEVSFKLMEPNAAQYNAMIHLEFLQGDSILLNAKGHHPSQAKKLASLPVPIGIQDGVVVFQCGTIKHAGPYRAFLTVNGERKVESDVLHVSWPLMSITVPSKLETYATDVSVTVSFTRGLCETFTTFGDWGSHPSPFQTKRKSRLGFQTQLDLIECSDSTINPEYQECQAPNSLVSQNDTLNRVWWSHPVPNLYRKSSFTVTLNCSVWGQSGTFRLYLRTNLSLASVVARSSAIRVHENRDFQIKNEEAPFVLPCLTNDAKAISVRSPHCSSSHDSIKVFGQGIRSVGNGNLVPSEWDYLGEKKISTHADVMFIPCNFFDDVYWKFCFHYVTQTVLGETQTMTKMCLSAKEPSEAIPLSSWSSWSPWSSCSVTCGLSGYTSRHRMCQLPQNTDKRILCEGHRVEQKPCREVVPCPGESLADISSARHLVDMSTHVIGSSFWTPLFQENTISPCSCGCIYIVGETRQIRVTSGQNCSFNGNSLRWRVRVADNDTMKVNVSLIQHSCLDGILEIRDGEGQTDRLYRNHNQRAPSSSSSSSDNNNSHSQSVEDPDDNGSNNLNGLLSRVGFFNSSELHIQSQGSVLTFELISPETKNCQINLDLDVRRVHTPMGSSSILQQVTTWFRLLFQHFPTLVLVLVSFLLVSIACCFCLICQIEYRKRKYVAWKSQASSGYSTPTHCAKNYIALEDIETAASSVDDIAPLIISRRKDNRKNKRLKFRMDPELIRDQSGLDRLEHHRRSLPSSPFLTRRLSPSSSPNLPPPSRPITAEQVKKALASKTRKGRGGKHVTRSMTKRPRVPIPTPTLLGAKKRNSKSLSDILAMLSQERDRRLVVIDPAKPKFKKPTAVLKPIVMANASPSKPRQASRFSLNNGGGGGGHGVTATVTTSSLRKPLLNHSLHRFNKSSTTLRSSDSQDTLKPTSSLSEFSDGGQSCMSGAELEFDLYDCNIENVGTYPGSMFAHPWANGDRDGEQMFEGRLSSLGGEDFQLTELFPAHSYYMNGGGHGGTLKRGDPLARNGRLGRDEDMIQSRTSDLTASVTSADLGASGYYVISEPDPNYQTVEDEDEARETDRLLDLYAVRATRRHHPNAIMNLTHIDDDISYADD
eukprot:TCALIF_02062-PA protein Name:"Similar to thbs1 Thrombospondin-1 (Xenopus laevis)" AED:0.16 eAED:0.09 QI:0/0.83/0.57/0.85/1/1/7/160/1139